jgi:hypothetical protein
MLKKAIGLDFDQSIRDYFDIIFSNFLFLELVFAFSYFNFQNIIKFIHRIH